MRKIGLGARASAAVALALASLVPARAGQALVRDAEAARATLAPANACARGETTLDCAQLDTLVEPSIAVNPEDPLNAVAVFQEDRIDSGGDADNGYATTFDGGQTWVSGHLPGLTTAVGGPFERASDPVAAFGPGGIVYANSLVLGDFEQQLAVNRSRDGGRTWGAPVFILPLPSPGVDKNWIVVDNGDGPGHHEGRVYVVWDTVVPVWAAYSDDEGATWQTGGGAGFVVYPGQGIGAIPLVLPSGDLAVVFETSFYPIPPVHRPEQPIEPIPGFSKFVVSLAAGAGRLPTGAPLAFAPPVTAGVWRGGRVRGQRAGEFLHAAAVDDRTGKIYVAWADRRFRQDVVNDIVVASSSDGVVWSAPVRVNGGPKNDFVDRWCPMIGVASDGSLRVAYRQRQENSGDPGTFDRRVDTYLQESRDEGESFAAPLKVSTPASDLAYAATSRGGAFLGDYDQLAVGGVYTYIARAEPVQVDPSEPRTFPPSYHHQRLWVAVAGPAPASAVPRSRTEVLAGRVLPETGVGAPVAPLAWAGLACGMGWGARRRWVGWRLVARERARAQKRRSAAIPS